MSHDFAKKGEAKKSGKVASKKAGTKKPSAKKSPAKKSPKKPPAKKVAPSDARKALPAWLWFLSGVITTLAVQAFYYLSQVETDEVNGGSDSPTQEQVNEFDAEIEKHIKQPEIRFYDELKNREVKVSGESVAEREQEDYNYALQAGSFKSNDDAEQLRVEILLLDLEASIESRKNDSGTTWHRVIVGPFTSRSKLSRARSILINNNIKSIRIKRS